MLKKTLLAVLGVVIVAVAAVMVWNLTAPNSVQAHQAAPPAKPSAGYDIHVLAPHMVDGHQMGPYHHYCKVIGEGPQIQCLIYDSTDANAPMTQVEWIYAKSMTRENVPLKAWNKNWHDHAVEIAGGRVQVLDMPPDKAKEVADLVSTTDGMIYHFYYDGKLPNGRMSIAQAVGHKALTAAQLKDYAKK